MVPTARSTGPDAADTTVVKPRVLVKGANGRRQLIDEFPLAPGEYLVEVTDRITEERAYLVAPVDPQAEVVARFIPQLRKALFADGAELRLKTIYRVRQLRGLERCIEARTGDELDSRVLSLFVIKRGPGQ
jgi:hypothetical protein